MHTDGSKQDPPDPILGAVTVVHPASGLTIFINATGQEELNDTILRAELAAMHQALTEFQDVPTLKCLTDSGSSPSSSSKPSSPDLKR